MRIGGLEMAGEAGYVTPGLRRARRAAFLTQQQLADRANVAGMTVSRAERGHVISLANVLRLAAALRTTPQTLCELGETEAVGSGVVDHG